MACNISVDPTLEAQIRYLYQLYHNWYPTKANILVGTAPPTGAVPEREYSLFLNKNTGQVFYASDGGVWRLVADIKGPTGDVGATGPTGPRGKRRHGHYDSCNEDCDEHHSGCHYDCDDDCSYHNKHGKSGCNSDHGKHCDRPCGPSHVYTSSSTECCLRSEYDGYPYHQGGGHHHGGGGGGHHHGGGGGGHNGHYDDHHYGKRDCPSNNHPLGNTPIPKVTQTEAINITPLGLANSVLTLTSIPCTCNASIDVSFCGSFANSINTMVQKAPSNGQVVVTASTNFWNVSMTMDFVQGQTKWSGAFNRALTLIPGTPNKVFISVSFHSEENQTSITLMGVNDFISARLMYDI